MTDHSALIERLNAAEIARLEAYAAALAATPYLNLYDAGDVRVVSDTNDLARLIRAVLPPLPSAPNQAKEAGE